MAEGPAKLIKSFQQNGSRNYLEGMLTGMRQNGILAIWASSTNNPHSLNHHHCPQCLSTLLIAVTNGQHQQQHITARHHPQRACMPQHSKNNATTPCHHTQLTNKCLEHTTVPRRCQQCGKRRTMTSVIIRCLHPR